MKNSSSDQTDEEEIRQIIEFWANATKTGKRDEVLSAHTPDVLIFDVLAPLKYEGAAAYRASWDEWQPETTGEGLFDLHELQVTAGESVAFAHALIHCGGTHPDGSTFEDWVRTTICLRKLEGRWLITHQHTSMPISPD